MKKLTRELLTEALELAARRFDLVKRAEKEFPGNPSAWTAGSACSLLEQIEGKLRGALQSEEIKDWGLWSGKGGQS